MAEKGQYSPRKVTMIWNNILIRGYGDGTFINAARGADAWSIKVGAHGDGAWIQNHDESGLVTVQLLPESSCNDELSLKARLDRDFGNGAGDLLIKDLNGRTVVHADSARIMKPSDVAYSKDGELREWVFGCMQMDSFVGGAIQ